MDLRMRKSLPTLVSIIIIASFSVSCLQSYKKITHNIDPTAVCLDGSPAALYEHIGAEKDKFLIFFGGGGSCGGLTLNQTIQNCYQRSKTYLGSSTYMLDSLIPQGMPSTDPNRSQFANWTKFIFAYCDGSFHQGNRDSPISYKNTKIYLRGSNITRAHLKYIQEKYDFKNASQVIVTGVSAGAMAAYMWTNHIQSLLNDPKAVSTIIDSGVFINDTSVQTGLHKSAIMSENLYKMSNLNEATPLAECNNFSTKGKEWNCFFFEHSYSLIKGRVMNLLSMYDSYDLKYQYEINCVVEGHEGETFDNCTSKEEEAIDERYGKSLALNDKFMALSEDHSSWGISCSNHVYSGNWKFYDSQNQQVGEMRVKEAVESFVLDKKRIIKIDNGKWPSNSKCAF